MTRGYWNINASDPEGALRTAEIALASRDTARAGHDIRGMAFILQNNFAEADKEARSALEIAPNHYLGKSLRALAAAGRGDRVATEAALRTFAADANRNHWAALRVALCWAKLGDRDQAITWLRRVAELGNHSWYSLITHPWFKSMQADPAFQQIVGAIKQDLDDVRGVRRAGVPSSGASPLLVDEAARSGYPIGIETESGPFQTGRHTKPAAPALVYEVLEPSTSRTPSAC